MDRTELLRRAFAFSMAEEGGATYTDDARDPGGPTKWGVALNYNREAIPDKDGNGVITAEDVRRLTAADALAIYTERYWRPHIRAEYPDALAFMLADMVFNPGPGAAPRLLQQACTACGRRIDADGYVGPQTLAAVAALAAQDLPALLRALAEQRQAYYRSRPGWPAYGRGWSARTRRCLEAALQLAGDA
ncbi:glycoside hydrolase family 108 protein [uncultured Desulfovibrio sp.]|uniref:glycoside hydrolase family 108 protein n=1 Tax=uncultured Desulfovibrio sp. TaxID=167968 RepID=UPI00266DB2AF|nr:glycosyl hydrolase 108 family protein [uncultured Desulfovibrio sp.]